MFERIKSNNDLAVDKAIRVLKIGGIIIYPTDTLYGFGCDANNNDAIKKINSIKSRKGPMSVLAPNIRMALRWMKIGKQEKLLVKEKLGGATTVIAPVKDDIVSGLIIGQDQTLGIRVPDHHFCNKLASKYLKPVITTSVNRSGEGPATIPDKIASQFSNEVELLVDDGIINQGGSTIYLLRDKNWKILRS